MAERLAVAEDRLARVMREEVMKSLAEAKLQLAQADFEILELQVLSLALFRWCDVNILARVDGNISWAWAEYKASWLNLGLDIFLLVTRAGKAGNRLLLKSCNFAGGC